ncbi:MAG: acetylglutamate kinase [Nitrospirae bacterium CG_4_9_14_3_um_filter_53_35]|nr:MAG: acetylglutamate kinase [Nitrospirae bacterium CG2_30_53_67]PIS37721.1 MAG: acetylglutamate kinase [Nitrospirae bacterium CG08_land_8_20_14_0_20_52_24]PIW85828.1 MAG: acetylglutamate kinase [Nitrospirae bacterium CG_4_8_14_3_um_filter_50_41]PIX86835.1 MAG: acetylglutamate kinase [Nitrospirae bacterium CG_4_10_14_3_um_filter_53_41]PJA77179.1 MAG: acetylglutamate kinase [Nitrospirae bacterium CG_4_9_14_3_um_filter_53_35]
MKKFLRTADVLIEALPYIRRFEGKTIVIKYGGSAMINEELKRVFVLDIILMKYVGIHPVIVHGGGPQIGKIMKKMGKIPKFILGQRVTDEETMDIVQMVLGGKINKDIVSLINNNGGKAVGLTGKDGRMIRAKKMIVKKPSPETGVPEIIDLGKVGEVEEVNPEIIRVTEQSGFIPVIAPVGEGENGDSYNINADLAAGSIAAALCAEKLILLTDVPGILNKKGQLVQTATKSQIERMKKDGTITSGMLPKVTACFNALNAGVCKAHIIDGRLKHAVLLELFTRGGVGTEIILNRNRKKK